MTYASFRNTNPTFAPGEIIGGYSLWPKKRLSKRFIAGSAVASAIGVFVHCGLPLLS